MNVLVIDDLRIARDHPEGEEIYARTPADGVEQLESQEWDFIFLDHDLGWNFTEGALTIWPCIEYIEANVEKFRKTKFTVVSSSPRAAMIVTALEDAGLDVVRWTMRDVSMVFKELDAPRIDLTSLG